MSLRLGISIGDVAGIGPEVVLKALETPLSEDVTPIVYGDRGALERERDSIAGGSRPADRRSLESVEGADAAGEGPAISVIDVVETFDASAVSKGRASAACAELQREAFDRAVEAARSGRIDAVVTAPWNKSALRLVDEPARGHTDVLAAHFSSASPVMMLAGPRLRVSLVTTHLALDDVRTRLSVERIASTLSSTSRGLRRQFGVEAPSLSVCGLNPHAGERATMGTAERDVIEPAVERARASTGASVSIDGPFPADTLFARVGRGQSPCDAVVCMYHDQGLVPLKLLHFGESANVTLGLPIVRTSVDHGTGYDIAGENEADPGSMRYALELAAEIAGRREQPETTRVSADGCGTG